MDNKLFREMWWPAKGHTSQWTTDAEFRDVAEAMARKVEPTGTVVEPAPRGYLADDQVLAFVDPYEPTYWD